jgi:hypothetical protein
MVLDEMLHMPGLHGDAIRSGLLSACGVSLSICLQFGNGLSGLLLPAEVFRDCSFILVEPFLTSRKLVHHFWKEIVLQSFLFDQLNTP